MRAVLFFPFVIIVQFFFILIEKTGNIGKGKNINAQQQTHAMLRNIISKRAFHAATRLQIAKPAADAVPIDRTASPNGYIQGKPVKNFYVDEETNEVVIRVQPLQREGESIEQLRKRLVYQSRKRGILETDLLLSRFAKKHLDTLTKEQLEEYDKLLDELDWDIYYWATKNFEITPLPDRWENSEVLRILQEDAKNKEKEILRMPALG